MSIIHTITEGGQVWTHRMRMLKQVVRIAFILSFLIALALFIYKMSLLDNIYYRASWYNVQVKLFAPLGIKNIEVEKNAWAQISRERYSFNVLIIESHKVLHYTNPYFNHLMAYGKVQLIQALIYLCLWFFAITIFFFIRGQFSKQKKHISGRKISPVWLVSLLLRIKRKASDIKIGSLPLVKNTETHHMMITGGTGSGKTNCFHHILPQMRGKKQKAVIIDTTGILLDRYFRKGKDFLLNPLDERTMPWHPWIECNDKIDYDSMAESFIPQSYSEHENYWRIAARSLFSSVIQKVNQNQETSDLTKWLLLEPLSKLCEFVQGTKAAAHLDLNSEKTAASVRSVASSFLNCLEFIKNTNSPFSIKNWVQNDTSDSWLFISCKPSQRASLTPLLSCWFSVAARSLLQMNPDYHRRVWFIVDELPSLNKLKDLEAFLSESRKYGGCAILSLQSPAQLEAIYGRESTQTIIGNCATKIVFSEQDPEIAEKISRAFGVQEIKEYQEGLSYGANEVRDGISLSLQTRQLPLVSSTVIQSLEKNEAYVKLPGHVPITKIKLKYIS